MARDELGPVGLEVARDVLLDRRSPRGVEATLLRQPVGESPRRALVALPMEEVLESGGRQDGGLTKAHGHELLGALDDEAADARDGLLAALRVSEGSTASGQRGEQVSAPGRAVEGDQRRLDLGRVGEAAPGDQVREEQVLETEHSVSPPGARKCNPNVSSWGPRSH